MNNIIVGIIIGLFITDLLYKNLYERKQKSNIHIENINKAENDFKTTQKQITKTETHISLEPINQNAQEDDLEQEKIKPLTRRVKTLDEEDEFEGDLPEELPIDNIKIVYCKYSHEKYYETLSSYITTNYTSVKVIGEPYPIPRDKEVTVNILMASQVISILLILGFDYIKPLLPFIPEKVFAFIGTSRILFAISCYLFHTYFINKIRANGAFEVYGNNKIIWSKLSQNKLPSYNDIIHLITIIN